MKSKKSDSLIKPDYRRSDGLMVYFAVKKGSDFDFHAKIINIASALEFSKEMLTTMDFLFEEQSDLFEYYSSENYLLDIFISSSTIHVVFHAKDAAAKDKLIKIIRTYFQY